MYLSSVTIQQFIKLSFEEKSDVIYTEGNLIDAYNENNIDVKVFSISDFFVEVIVNTQEEKVVDIIPYTRGFSFFSKRKETLERSVALLNNFFII